MTSRLPARSGAHAWTRAPMAQAPLGISKGHPWGAVPMAFESPGRPWGTVLVTSRLPARSGAHTWTRAPMAQAPLGISTGRASGAVPMALGSPVRPGCVGIEGGVVAVVGDG